MTARGNSSFERDLSASIADIEYASIPESAIRTAERSILDTIGVAIAGFETDVGDRILRFARATDADVDQHLLDVLFADSYASPADAALAIGTAAHVLDYDDTSAAIRGHPSATLVPTLCALAPRASQTGKEAITAYVAGFEAAAAIAAPIVTEHYKRGWHATATIGVFGATATSAVSLGLDESEIGHALNVAASMASGLKANFGSMTKPLQAGLAARSGVTAAELAQSGFTADPRAISRQQGFWALYANGADSVPTLDRFRLTGHGIYLKKYPCCRATQTSLDATLALVKDHDITPAEIRSIEVLGSANAKDILKHPAPTSSLEAKFSIPYTVAHAVVHRSVGLDAFEDDRVGNPSIEAIRELITFQVDPDLSYNSQDATVRIRTDDGTFETIVEDTYGDATANPLTAITDEEVRKKFLECTRSLASDALTRDLFQHFDSLRSQSTFAVPRCM